jgi:transposase-like protein
VSESTMTTEREAELPERWSAQRKTEIVLRVIRGEAIDEVAREIQVPVHGPRPRKLIMGAGLPPRGMKLLSVRPWEWHRGRYTKWRA